MYFRTNNLRKESFKWRVHEMLSARRVAETNKSQLMNLMPVPEEVALPELPPDWSMIPLCQPVPNPTMAPAGLVQFTRGKLGENILRPSKTFDLGDPYCHDLKLEYEPIHDPYLKHFLLLSHVRKYIEDLGVITEGNKVKCSPKSYNAYRHYMWTVQRNGIKDKLLNKERIQLLKKRFGDFLDVANHVKAQHLKVRSVEKEIMMRKFVRKFNIMLENMLRDLRKKESAAGTQKVINHRNDLWIIHLVKERDYPSVKALYKTRAFAASAYKGVNFVLKWRNHYLWEDGIKDIKGRCRKLRDITLALNWDRKRAEQISLLTRDFIIFNDYLTYSARRVRNRERWYRMDRLAMKAKFDRLRYDRDYSMFPKLQKMRKYGMTADFLLDNVKHAKLAVRAWELQPKKKVRRRHQIRKHYMPRGTGRPVTTTGLYGRLFAGQDGKMVAWETMLYFAARYANRTVRAAGATQLSLIRRQLKCMVARIRNRKKNPMITEKELRQRYRWQKKLPYRAITDNWDPKRVVRRKLLLAVRRHMKHERRRLRVVKKFPEWSYYDKKAAKYNSKELIVTSQWRKLKLYFPLLPEQYNKKDWKGSCKSLGKYLLYILVNNQSFTTKKRKVCSIQTLLKATILKLKNKARILLDGIKRIVAKKIRLYYPKEIHKHFDITRAHVRSLLPKNPRDGDGYLQGITHMLTYMKLQHIHFQHLIPFADRFLLYVCYPVKFHLRFKKYRVDLHRREQLMQQIFPYRTNPLPYREFYRKVRKVHLFRKRFERDPAFLMQVYVPRLKKYIVLYKNITYSRFLQF